MAVDGEAGCQLSADNSSIQTEALVVAKCRDDLISERGGVRCGVDEQPSLALTDNIVFSTLREPLLMQLSTVGVVAEDETDSALSIATVSGVCLAGGLPDKAEEVATKCSARLEVKSWMADSSTGCKFLSSRDLLTAKHSDCIDDVVMGYRRALVVGDVVEVPCADGDRRTTT